MAGLSKILAFQFLLVFALNAHEHWLYTESNNFAPGDSITVHLRSGHTAEESEFLIDTKLIQEAFIISPTGQQSPLHFQVNGNEHTCTFQSQEAGIYTILTNLRKRSQGPFTYLLKTQIQVGPDNKMTDNIPSQELEIVFGETEHSLQVLAAGEPMKVPIVQMSQGHDGHSLSMDRYGVSAFTPDTPGFQVAICHFRRQTASYSFYLGD